MTWLKRTIRKGMRRRHRWFAAPGLRWLAPYLDRPAYWSLQRRKVAMGVAVGLYAGVMPGFTQKLTAMLLVWLFRINLPVAMLTSLYSNPLTVLPLYYVAYRFGAWLLGSQAVAAPPPGGWQASLRWLFDLGAPLLVGMPALGLLLGALGYLLTMLFWRMAVVSAWNNRKVKCGSA